MNISLTICLVVTAAITVSSMNMGSIRKPNEEVTEVASQIRSRVEDFFGRRLPEFRVVAFKRKTVAGTHYVLKIKIGGEYIHVKVFHSLSGHFTRIGVQRGHTRLSPISWFDSPVKHKRLKLFLKNWTKTE